MTDSRERWRIACHEGGHAAAGFALSHPPQGAVTLDNQGFVLRGDATDLCELAVVAACGPAAEFLADLLDAPPEVPATDITAAEDWNDSESRLVAYRDKPFVLNAPPDFEMIRRWATRDERSELWHARVMRVKRDAELLVHQHAGLILRVATALFERTVVDEDGLRRLINQPVTEAEQVALQKANERLRKERS